MVSRPAPPSLFVLSSQGDLQAYRTGGTSPWQTNADTNSESIPNAQGIHWLNTGQMVSVATGTIRAYSSSFVFQERLEFVQTQSKQRYCKAKSEIEEELKSKTEAAEELRLSRWEVMD